MTAPRLWIVAGHNGAGKTTFVDRLRKKFPNMDYLNADAATEQLIRQAGLPVTAETRQKYNLRAAQDVDMSVSSYIDMGFSFCVETVLSSKKYQPLVELALAQEFQIIFQYICLSTADHAMERVRMRVASGGHDVPVDKIRARRLASLSLMPWFAQRAHFVQIFCNDFEPVELARKVDGHWSVFNTGMVPELSAWLESVR